METCQFNDNFYSFFSPPELGEFLIDIAAKVPGGMVVFFPSYSYEEHVVSHLSAEKLSCFFIKNNWTSQVSKWESSGLLARLNCTKPYFREPRVSTDMEAILRRYSQVFSRFACGIFLCFKNQNSLSLK